MTKQELTRLYERQVNLAVELIEDAECAYPEISAQIVQMAPAILTTALGVPVNPDRLDELVDAKRHRENHEDGADLRFWERRFDDLLSAIIRPALAVAS